MVIVTSKQKYDTECTNCRSELSYEYEDIEKWTDENFGDVVYKDIVCPVCQFPVTIHPEEEVRR